jgi:hypothetical protein
MHLVSNNHAFYIICAFVLLLKENKKYGEFCNTNKSMEYHILFIISIYINSKYFRRVTAYKLYLTIEIQGGIIWR